MVTSIPVPPVKHFHYKFKFAKIGDCTGTGKMYLVFVDFNDKIYVAQYDGLYTLSDKSNITNIVPSDSEILGVTCMHDFMGIRYKYYNSNTNSIVTVLKIIDPNPPYNELHSRVDAVRTMNDEYQQRKMYLKVKLDHLDGEELERAKDAYESNYLIKQIRCKRN